MKTAAAVLAAAARVAGEGGSASAALRAAGSLMPDPDQLRALGVPLETILGTPELDQPLIEAICLGYLAGSTAPRRRRPRHDVTAFLMDENLVIQAAAGESILRLPWFEPEMFVGRQLPDAVEIPSKIRALAVDSYREALHGTRTDYAFTSYGHSYSVDAVPLCDASGRRFVMAIATPGRSAASAVSAAARNANRLQQAAQEAEMQAQEFLASGRRSSAALAFQRAQAVRQAADRARRHAERLAAQNAPPRLTQREVEILTLASHGCSYTEIAEQLVLSPATVKTHLHHCYTKLAVPDKAAAVAAALRHGLIE
ncbi:MAG TPA: LuxR C-terminal-related transcriptional regulator [Solirubrobacteraceae bacterium]|nr:LuxR C-terminal-related transcriptional regulator [Solirubrobacteraceae bacterium]